MEIYISIKNHKRCKKKNMSEVRGQVYEELYRKLDMKGCESDVYKIVKFREKNTKSFN
jgi:hypothetical protein